MENGKRNGAPAQSSGGGKKIWIGIAVAAALLLIGYGILCYLPSRGNTFYEGTVINDLAIGGMEKEEALALLEDKLDGVTTADGKDYSHLEVRPDMEGAQTYEVDLSAALTFDVEGAVEKAYAHDRGGMILTRGWHYLENLISGGKEYTILPYAEEETKVLDALKASGILDLNTTVETAWELKEETLDVTIGTSGVVVDSEKLTQKIMEQTAAGNFEPIVCELENRAPAQVTGQQLHEATAAEPKDATLATEDHKNYTMTDSVRGVDFDPADADTLLSGAAEGQLVQIPLEREEPKMDSAKLEEVLFRDVLGGYTTHVSGSSGRKSNVRLCAEKINGYILLPGEEFDYNKVVGKRTKEAGFYEAGAYLEGKTVMEVGGGVCQGSTTLYCAALYSNMEIVTRRNHTYPSSYSPLGMDATVSWGGPEFVFKNNTDYPVKIVAWYKDSKVHFELHGTMETPFKVEIVTSTLQTIPPTRKEVPDPEMLVGEEKIEEKGHTGYKVQSYRKVYDGEGNLISKEKEAYSSYRMTEQIVRVGTKPLPVEPPVTPPADPGAPVPPATPEGTAPAA